MSEEIIHVELWECVGAFVIVKRPSGIWYTNQCGGTMCAQPEEEGFLVPMERYHGDEEQLSSMLEDTWFKDPESFEEPWDKEDEETLNKLVSSFESVGHGDNVWRPQLDLERWRDKNVSKGEAWVPVTTPFGPGWLTWENSD